MGSLAEQGRPYRHRDRVLLAVFLLAVFVPGTVGVSLFDRDEGWYAQITREMVASGEWIVPRYLGEPRYFKPPLLYWCSALSTGVLGWSEFALRLPCVLVAVGAWGVVAGATARRFGRRAAWWTAILGGTCLGSNVVGKLMLADGYLLLFVAWGMDRWLRCLELGDDRADASADVDEPDRARKRAAMGSWIALGLAVLAKGPAVLVVVVPIGLAFLWTESPRGTSLANRFRRLWPGPGWYLAALIGLPWYVAAAVTDWHHFKTDFLLVHFVSRLKDPAEGHWGPPGYYLLGGLVFLWPWAALVPSAIAAGWARRRADPTTRRLLVWLIAPWIAFELIQTKLPHYALPLVPPVVMLLARELARVSASANARLKLDRFARGLWIAGGGLGAAVALAGAIYLRGHVPIAGLVVIAIVLAGGTALAAWPRGVPSWRPRLLVIAASVFVVHQIAGWIVMPSLEPYRLSRNVAAHVNTIANAGDEVLTLGFAEPTLYYYLDHPARALRLGNGSTRGAADLDTPFVLIARASKLDALRTRFDFDLDGGRFIEGVNYVRGRRERIWIGRVAGRP